MKKDKFMWLTTIICILPIILSVILYDKLPAQVPIHFDTKGEANNYAPKAVAAFGLPVFMALLNIVSHFKLNNDPIPIAFIKREYNIKNDKNYDTLQQMV